MCIKSSLISLLLLINIVINVKAFNFNNSLEFYGKDALGSNRSGKFLFDTLFGLELEQEIIDAASSTNTLKSCDCGEL
jgi:hypothetical protein